jgi:predicted Zn-dependent peptidase
VRVVVPGDRARPADETATALLLYLLGETGYAGRLGRALVDPGLVYSVYATREEEGAPGFLMVRTAAAPRDTPEVLRRIREILETAAAGRFTAAELREAQAYLRGKDARAREGSAAAARDLLEGSERGPRGDPAAVSLDQLNDTARRLFRNGAPVAIVAGPPEG